VPNFRVTSLIALAGLLGGGLLLAALAADAPIAPGRAQGWLRADALSALLVIMLATHGLVERSLRQCWHWRDLAAIGLLALTALAGHLALIAALLTLGVAMRAGRRRPTPLLAALAAAGGLLLLGLVGGEWRYAAPAAGSGLNSTSFGLLLLGALLSVGGVDLARGRAPGADPLAAAACLYALLRLFSLGPWSLGWLFAALLVGAAVTLAAAWQGAAALPAEAAAWQGAYLGGIVLVGVGLGSDAGVVLAGYGLLLGPVLRLGLMPGQSAECKAQRAEQVLSAAPAWPRWLLCAATPLTAPFVLAWMAVAAALAGELTLLAAALWAAALLAALPVGRLAGGRAAQGDCPPEPSQASRVYLAGALSAGLGLGAPLALAGLLAPIAAQLQGGLTPFGIIELWPWAGLLALSAARQPVATLPLLALAALLLILAALGWTLLRVLTTRRR
jgi:hypothetical protein